MDSLKLTHSLAIFLGVCVFFQHLSKHFFHVEKTSQTPTLSNERLDRELNAIISECLLLDDCGPALNALDPVLPKVARAFHAITPMSLTCNGHKQFSPRYTQCFERFFKLALKQIVIWRDGDAAFFKGTDFNEMHEQAVWVMPLQHISKDFWNHPLWRGVARRLLPQFLHHRSRFTGQPWCTKKNAWRKLFYKAPDPDTDLNCITWLQELLILQTMDNATVEREATFQEFQKASWGLPWKHWLRSNLQHPNITLRPFWETEHHWRVKRWEELLRAGYSSIRAEFQAVLQVKGWSQLSAHAGAISGLYKDSILGGWEKVQLYRGGSGPTPGWNEEGCKLFPTICYLLQQQVLDLDPAVARRARLDGEELRLPPLIVAIYGLAPGAHLRLHAGHGLRLVSSLPLQVPQGCCSLQVSDEIRLYEEGQVLTFDDSLPHEVSNVNPDQWRFALNVDYWHPEILDQLPDDVPQSRFPGKPKSEL